MGNKMGSEKNTTRDIPIDVAVRRYALIRDKDARAEVRAGLAGLPGRLRGLRLSSGFTLEEVGEFIGCSRESLRNYESGKYVPNVVVLYTLAAFYGVSVDWLLTGKEW